MPDQSSETTLAARVAARWWADKVRAGFVPSNGDDSFTGAFASGLGSILRERQMKDVKPEQVDEFERLLAVSIQTQHLDRGMHGFGFGTDYGPDPIVGEPLTAAGLPTSALPWKTLTWVSPTSVQVGDGYGAEPVDLPMEEPR